MTRRLGVLVTYHDEGPLLTEGLESLLAQAGDEVEVLIHDDASPRHPATDHVPRDPRVRVLRAERNRGPAVGRNVLLRAASADAIHFHDADDIFAPGWVEAVLGALAAPEVDAVFTELERFMADGTSTWPMMGLADHLRRDDLVAAAIRGGILCAAGTYRRAAALRIGGYRESLWQSEDYDFHVRLAASGIDFVFIDRPLVRVRDHAHNRSKELGEVWRSAVQALALLGDELVPEHRPALADAAVAAGRRLLTLGDAVHAAAAFDLAARLGPAPLRHDPRLRRWADRLLGHGRAAVLARHYRALLPARLRRALRGGGKRP
ncbi:MAG: glycosyltransferase [Planctomycetes bacterium]|nr:glycosyltransferase [Planctomycetota bacterium]